MLITSISQFDNYIEMIKGLDSGYSEDLFLYQKAPKYKISVKIIAGPWVLGNTINFTFKDIESNTDIEKNILILPLRNNGLFMRQDENFSKILKNSFVDFIISERGADNKEPMDGDAVNDFSNKYGLDEIEKLFVNEHEGNL